MREQSLLRIGAVCALLGALAALAGQFAHPVLPPSVEEVLRLVAGIEAWRGVHLTIIVGAVLFLGAFLALAQDFPTGGRLGAGPPGLGGGHLRRHARGGQPGDRRRRAEARR